MTLKPSDRLTVLSDEISQDLPVVAAFVREFGLKGIELRSAFGRAFKDLTAADLAEVGWTAGSEGWAIYGCATPVFKCELGDTAATREHGEIFRRSLDTAQLLDCKLLRVFTFLRRAGAGPLAVDTAKQIAEHLRPLCDLAAEAGIKVGIENAASCLVGTPAETALLCQQLAHPAAGIIWDPCNVLYVPEWSNPVPGQSAAEALAAAYRELAPHIIHVHVKDALRAPGGPQAAPVGAGHVGWAEQLGAIRESSYSGLISLETHWRKAVALDAHTLHLPGGYGFSAGGEEASRICFSTLRKLWG